MNVVIFEVEDWEAEEFQQRLSGHDLDCTTDALNDQTAAKYADVEIISTFGNSSLNQGILRRLPALRLIVTRSVGYDHIAMEYCRDNKITVCNVPDYGDYTVAEHAFALLLAVNRHIVAAVERCRQGDFNTTGLRGIELRGRTLGIIGTGRIGCRAIEIAGGFGMTVVAHDAWPDKAKAARLGFRYVTLSELLTSSDIITLHVPGTAASHHLLSDREFAQTKRGVVIINTARGSVVDPEALLRALASGQVAAAGLDVLPLEPLIRDEAQVFRTAPDGIDFRGLAVDHALLRHRNVIVTPHNAYNTIEAMHRIVNSTIEIIDSFARGTAQNVVVDTA
jgi:D-lactate dehydrogenase